MQRMFRGVGIALGLCASVGGCVTQARNYGGAQPSESSSGGTEPTSTTTLPSTQPGAVTVGTVSTTGTGSAQAGPSSASTDGATGTEGAMTGYSDGSGGPKSVETSGTWEEESPSEPSPTSGIGILQTEGVTDGVESSASEVVHPTEPIDSTGATPSLTTSPLEGSDTPTSSVTSDTTPPIPLVDKYFTDWPQGKEPLEIGKRAAAIFTSKSLPTGSGHSNTDDYKHYKDACAWYGALSVALVAGERLLIDSLIAKYEPYKNTWSEFNPPTVLNDFVGTVDDSLFGIVPLSIAKFRSDAIYVEEGDLAADHQIAFIDQQKRYTSDDMFMITALQVQAYRVITDGAHRRRHLDMAADTMVEYLELMQRSDGLIPHHLDREDFAIAWGRGNGWFAAGMAELIRELPNDHQDYDAIADGYSKMMNGLLQYQVPQGQVGAGLWKQVVDSSDSRNWVETSGSAMFTYALVSGVRAGWLDIETFGPAARDAWLGLVGQLNTNGEIQHISDWAYLPESHGLPANAYEGDEENYYFQRGKLTGDGHGQSPLMWAAAELTRSLD